jgi:hyperpolarization activated cyclic nucleotide-gated potassium channel 2
MLTVGYGDVTPVTVEERGYAICAMIIACGVFAYVVGSVEAIF